VVMFEDRIGSEGSISHVCVELRRFSGVLVVDREKYVCWRSVFCSRVLNECVVMLANFIFGGAL
jgi:hypothetical protein